MDAAQFAIFLMRIKKREEELKALFKTKEAAIISKLRDKDWQTWAMNKADLDEAVVKITSGKKDAKQTDPTITQPEREFGDTDEYKMHDVEDEEAEQQAFAWVEDVKGLPYVPEDPTEANDAE